MSEQHLDDDRLSLVAALDARDPERALADEHCAQCPACNKRLTAAQRELDALDAIAAPLLTPAEIERARIAVASAIDFDASPAPNAASQAVHRAVEAALVAAAIAAPFVVGTAFAAPPSASQLASSIAALCWGVVASLGVARKRERRSAATLSIVGSAALIAVSDASPQGNSIFFLCAVFELAAAVIPTAIAATLIARRRSALDLASVAAASALAASLTLRVSCLDRHLSHVLVTHVGGVALAALFGAVVQRFVANDEGTLRHT